VSAEEYLYLREAVLLLIRDVERDAPNESVAEYLFNSSGSRDRALPDADEKHLPCTERVFSIADMQDVTLKAHIAHKSHSGINCSISGFGERERVLTESIFREYLEILYRAVHLYKYSR
jgi:hypothetical protein